MNATANEVFADVQSLFYKLQKQTGGNTNRQTKMTLAMSPTTEVAMTITNSFGVSVSDLLKKAFPNMEVKSAVQYGLVSTANPQGNAAGELVQLIVDEIQGKDVGFCAFNEKLRAHKIIPATSSFKQKETSGSWGAIIRLPMGITSMVGV